jgi:2-keto-4-pentenoate hydratase/2-oxohepta-3-ene-1,7-dioic acid hydratase in catechol pathway
MQVFTTTEGVVRVDNRGATLLADLVSLDEVLAAGKWDQLADYPAGPSVNLESLTVKPPVVPATIVLVGLNYRSHADETGQPVPDAPLFFPIGGDAVVASGDVIPAPPSAPNQVDYEGEIGVVISRSAHQVAAADAWSYVAGLTPVNDVSARDVQKAGAAQGDMVRVLSSKRFPGFKPLGPGILTGAHHADLKVTTSVNGELRQQATLGDLIFDVPTLIEAVTASIELRPGDIISTGSPAGVGFVSGRFLVPGDVVEITLGDLPPLRNVFAHGSAAADEPL